MPPVKMQIVHLGSVAADPMDADVNVATKASPSAEAE
jgi:hypothetical protein